MVQSYRMLHSSILQDATWFNPAGWYMIQSYRMFTGSSSHSKPHEHAGTLTKHTQQSTFPQISLIASARFTQDHNWPKLKCSLSYFILMASISITTFWKCTSKIGVFSNSLTLSCRHADIRKYNKSSAQALAICYLRIFSWSQGDNDGGDFIISQLSSLCVCEREHVSVCRGKWRWVSAYSSQKITLRNFVMIRTQHNDNV